MSQQTVLFSILLTTIFATVGMLLIWVYHQKRFQGIELWLAHVLTQACSSFLFLLAGSLPNWATYFLPNILVNVSPFLLLVGLEKFIGKRRSQLPNLVLLAAYLCLISFFTFGLDNYKMRVAASGLVSFLFHAQIAWLLMRSNPSMKQITLPVAWISIVFSLFSLLRIILALFNPTPITSQVETTDQQIYALLGYQALVSAQAFALLLITNTRIQLEVGQHEAERQRQTDIMQARLNLLQYAIHHPLEPLLQATIDEAERLTGSQIGFHHFFDSDQNAVLLQTWSTGTKATYCKAEGIGLHYPIEKAGVWIDCVLQRRPVIHNNYAALPHRKGLPEGHAPVIRELVVPIIRNDRVVAILGVGNKPSDYDEDQLVLRDYRGEIWPW